ncbi:MAG TPA: carboxypeptidase-like regulatory domain-containing protein [Edaphobacter sp.]|nr:carboxypeptidase-like regulatory domain-containing protein [Edaphobacter sp.]
MERNISSTPSSVPGTLHRSVYRTLAVLVCVISTLLFLAAPASAQLDTGGVTGTVLDPGGAIVPGAKITLTNSATGVTATTDSTSTGTYVFDGVRPGTYTLRSSPQGFQPSIIQGIEVHVQRTVTLDIHLSTGNVAQQITVTAASPLLQSEDAAVGQTIGTQTVNNLPLNGRNWVSLAQLSAGVSTSPVGQPAAGAGTTDSAYFSVDGVNMWQNDIRLNGINDNIEFYGGSYTGSNAAITPPPDAIQEFKLQNGNFSAEFGHSTGGIVNAVLKSGTNRLHGNVWEYLRNDAMDANSYFNNQKNLPKSEYRQNQFGFTLGGPVVLPKLYNGRDKTFFFVDYQGTRIIQPAPATSTVPTAAMAASGFTNLQDLITYNKGTRTDALGRKFSLGTVLDPATTRSVAAGAVDPVSGSVNSSSKAVFVRDPFYSGGSVGGITDFTGRTAMLNQIPVSRVDPNAVKLLNLYPAPTSSGLANNFYYYTPKQPLNINIYDIRIDHNFNPNNIIFGVFDKSYYDTTVPGNLPGLAVGQTGGRNDSLPAYMVAAGYTHIFTPTLTNEMHFGYTHSGKYQRSFYGNTFGIPEQYGINGIPQVAENGGISPINISGLKGLGVGNFTPTIQTVYSIEGSDSVTKVYRNHTFKAGFQIDSLEGDISQPPQGRSNMTFNGQYSDIPNQNSSLNGIADLLLVPTASSVGGPNNVGGMSTYGGSNVSTTRDHRWYAGGFFQDDWKLTPELTLNLGLRWDYFTPYVEVDGRQANFIADGGGNGNTGTYYIPNKGCKVARSAAFDTLLATSGIKLACVDDMALGSAQPTNFAPRIGFAYRFRPSTVVRGGYGIAYGALGNLGYGGTLGTNYPFVYTSTFNSNDSQTPITTPGGKTATLETAYSSINLQDPTINSGLGLNLYGRQHNFQTPYVQTVNLTVQDQFTNHDSIQIAYVGTLGRHLDNLGGHNSLTKILPPGTNVNANVPFTQFAPGSTYESTDGVSNYQSAQLTYEHQVSHGLSLLANYTLSKCMSDQKTQAKATGNYRAQWLPGFGIAGDNGLCDVDAMHVAHISGTYALPIGHQRAYLANTNAFVDAIVGGWSANFIYSYQSGQPFTIGCPIATTSGLGCNANVVQGADIYAGPHNQTQWLNPDAFANPAKATAIGQTDYSVLGGGPQQARGPGFNNLDSSIFKDFNVKDAMQVQFRAEAFNTLNTPQFAQPGSLDFTNKAAFSSITSLRNNARLLQLALKLSF